MGGGSSVRSAIRNPLAWAFMATFLSLVALVVAVGAYGRAGSGESADAASPQSTTVGADPATPTTAAEASTPADEPTEETTATGDSDEPLVTTLPSPGASYTVFKQDVQMRLVDGDQRFVDLDQPLVNSADTAYDVIYDAGTLAQPKLSFRSDAVAVGKSATVTPDECAQEIQLSPVDSQVELSQDLVLCAVTNGLGDVNEPARTKMARIVVNSVSKDNSVNLTVTTWEIPR